MSNEWPHRPTIAHIDLNDLAFNFRSVRKFIGKQISYMCVVKADAYGHGAADCALRLEHEGADWFGVAIPEEGEVLRMAGITKPILSLGSFWPGQEHKLLDLEITPTVFGFRAAEILDRAAAQRDTVANVHVKIDTGMGRVGVPWRDAAAFAARLSQMSNLHLEGMMTHFAAADDLSETAFTNAQISRFQEAVAAFRDAGFSPNFLDLANSPGAIAHPDSHGNMVRLGGVLYGLGDDVLPSGIEKPALKPVMSLTTKLAMVKQIPAGESLGYGRTYYTKRDSIVGTVPIGYEDGFRRSLSNLGRVIVNGQFAPILGRVSMDWTTIDLTDAPGASVGSEVTIIGQQNDLRITAEDLASQMETSSYEVTCGLSSRVPRVFSSGTERE